MCRIRLVNRISRMKRTAKKVPLDTFTVLKGDNVKSKIWHTKIACSCHFIQYVEIEFSTTNVILS